MGSFQKTENFWQYMYEHCSGNIKNQSMTSARFLTLENFYIKRKYIHGAGRKRFYNPADIPNLSQWHAFEERVLEGLETSAKITVRSVKVYRSQPEGAISPS